MAATARHFVNALVQWAIPNFTTSPEMPLIQSPETPLLTIEDLPPELLTCILEWLEEANAAQPGAHRKDLCSLCRTTRTISAVAIGRLYREYVGNAAALRSFLRTITQQPSSAKYLKTTSICLWVGVPPSPKPSFSEYVGFFQALSPLAMYQKLHGRLTLALKAGGYDAEAALLLLVAGRSDTTKLFNAGVPTHEEDNDVAVPGFSDTTSLPSETLNAILHLHQEQTPTLKPLQFLKELEINQTFCLGSEGLRLDFSTIVASLRLPSLKRLGISGGYIIAHTPTDKEEMLPMSKVTSLTLSEVTIDHSALSLLLRRCAGLEHLNIELSEAIGPGNTASAFNFDHLTEALDQHCETLVVLQVDLFLLHARFKHKRAPTSRKFTNLKSLDAESISVIPPGIGTYHPAFAAELDPLFVERGLDNILPPGLERLELRSSYRMHDLAIITRAFRKSRLLMLDYVKLTLRGQPSLIEEDAKYGYIPFPGLEISPIFYKNGDNGVEHVHEDRDGNIHFDVFIEKPQEIQPALLAFADKIEEAGLEAAVREALILPETAVAETGSCL